MAEPSTLKQGHKKVFVFTPPHFETTPNALRKGQVKRKSFAWKISQFDIDINPTRSEYKQSKLSISKSCDNPEVQLNGSQEISEINLEYDAEDMRDSMLIYLDNMFTENSGFVESTQEFKSQTYNESKSSALDSYSSDTCRKTVQQEYEDALQQSQKVLAESQGFIEMSLSESNGSLTDSFIQMTSMQANVSSTDSSVVRTAQQTNFFSSSITKLSSCIEHLSKVTIFAVVLQVNPIKEILAKSGFKSGQFVRVSSILVSDPSKEYFKLTFWEKAAKWVTNLVSGDVVIAKNVKLERWQNEFYGQSVFDTTLVNLQQVTGNQIPCPWLTFVSKNEARSFINWLNFRHPYLAVEQPRAACSEVTWQTLQQFKANSLIHYRAKVVKVLTYNNVRGSYSFGSRKVNKVMAIATDTETSEEIPIYLWGSQGGWQYELKARIGQMWDFKYLRVECKGVHGDFILHTTPESTKLPTQPSLVPTVPTQMEELSFSCISDLLKASCTGRVSISANVTSVSIEKASVDRNCVLNIDTTSDSETIQQFFQELVYLGCKSCLRALKQDHNYIYIHCSHCENRCSTYTSGVKYCYKQCRICFSDSSASIVATSFHTSTIKLLKGFDPQDALEDILKTNELFHVCSNIFNVACRPIVHLYCETKLDENGFVEWQTFELVDVRI